MLSQKMKEALEALKLYGEYELWELRHWNVWWPVIRNSNAPHIQTNTMKALTKRGLVEKTYDESSKSWKWVARIVLQNAGDEEMV